MNHHKIKIEKTYTNGEKRTPYKWVASCTCGWGSASWSWSRSLEAARYDKWIEENGQPTGGVLVWALEHLDLLPDQSGIYPPLTPQLEGSTVSMTTATNGEENGI